MAPEHALMSYIRSYNNNFIYPLPRLNYIKLQLHYIIINLKSKDNWQPEIT